MNSLCSLFPHFPQYAPTTRVRINFKTLDNISLDAMLPILHLAISTHLTNFS